MKIFPILFLAFLANLAFAQENAPSGVYLTSGFRDQKVNNRILICEGGVDLETWCRVIEERAVFERSGTDVYVWKQTRWPVGVLTGRSYSGALGLPKSSGKLLEVELNRGQIEYKTSLSFSWRYVDANSRLQIPGFRKSTKVKFLVLDSDGEIVDEFQAPSGTYQF
jgi:hypothetical protein